MRWLLLGFGEVGSCFAEALRVAGDPVRVYVRRPDAISARGEALGVELASQPHGHDADVVLSCVWAGAAEDVARQAAGTAAAYVDATNAGIAATERMAASVAGFHKAAILAPVARHGARTPMLLAGPRADELAAALNERGFNVRAVGPEPRQAAAIKILRSVATKCIVALLHDMQAAAARYGVEDQVLESAGEFFATEPFADLARTLLRQSGLHAERLAGEMDEVAEALRVAGVSERVPDLAREVFREIAAKGGLT
jgi:3-hydroxyisobutyrate dehydrogenase-like beta-hydroxyacid dehydrogenase